MRGLSNNKFISSRRTTHARAIETLMIDKARMASTTPNNKVKINYGICCEYSVMICAKLGHASWGIAMELRWAKS